MALPKENETLQLHFHLGDSYWTELDLVKFLNHPNPTILPAEKQIPISLIWARPTAVISDVQIEDFPHLLIPPPTETETSMTESFKNQLLADLVDQEFREAREIAVAEVAAPTADPWVTHLMKRIIFTPDLPFVKTIVIPKFVKETRVIAQSYIERVTNQMEYNVVVLPHHHEEANMIWKMTDGTVTAVPEIAKWWLGSGNPTPSDMKILIWNCRGAANSEFKRVFTDLVRTNRPSICFLAETKISGDIANRVVASLGFGGSHIINARGFAGGLWMLWDPDQVDINVLPHGEQAIHAVAKVRSSHFDFNWLISGIYASPRLQDRLLLWDELKTISDNYSGPWSLMRDFNEIFSEHEKFGGNGLNSRRVQAYSDCVNYCNLVDLGFVGPQFTWTSVRNCGIYIMERLDRVWANTEWRTKFPETVVHHLPRFYSDHNPLLLDLSPRAAPISDKPFRFQTCWLSHPDFKSLVESIWNNFDQPLSALISTFKDEVCSWNKDVFGNVFKRKRILRARLTGIERSLARFPDPFLVDLQKSLVKDYQLTLQQEEEIWKLKSRIDWVAQGDRNTSYFHTSTIIRRKKNAISGLEDSLGNWSFDVETIKRLILNHFKDLYTTSHYCSLPSQSDTWVIPGPSLATETYDMLTAAPTNGEIKKALFGMKPLKAPGPDGLHPTFFQKFWSTVGDSVCRDIKLIFHCAVIPQDWNNTLISLIPKVNNPETINQFRPIGLCNTTYRIVTKMLVNRIGPLLEDLISPFQSSFLLGRKGSDNAIIIQEAVHAFSKKRGQAGFMMLKIDLEKAYDRLEWSFIRETLVFFNFPVHLIKLIMSCICSANLAVLVNGGKSEEFTPSRGIRQGDPLSPYIFILCLEFLSLTISHKMQLKQWKGFRICRGGPVFSHLFFADDLVLFSKASMESCVLIKEVLNNFCNLSGQSVNFQKSRIYFSGNTNRNLRDCVIQNLDMLETDSIGRYLGYNIQNRKPKKVDCQHILEKIGTKLASWQTKFLTPAARTLLVNSVISATASYYMQAMKIPMSVLNEIDRDKKDGGLGIRSAAHLNEAFISKLGWNIINNDQNMWAETLKAKYVRRSTAISNQSPLWKAIEKTGSVLAKGTRWVIKDGNRASLWMDDWTGLGPLKELVVGPLHQHEDRLTVRTIIDGEGGWDFSVLSLQLPHRVCQAIWAIPIQATSTGQDCLSWKGTADGKFTIKSAYHLARGSNVEGKFNWKWVWKTPTHPKIQHFIWLTAHGRLVTRSYLKIIGIISDDLCPMCNEGPETIQHLFIDCPHTASVWNQLHPPPLEQCTCPYDWLKANCSNSKSSFHLKIPWNVVFAMFLWYIWNRRNDKVFNKDFNTQEPVHNIIAHAAEFFAVNGSIKANTSAIRLIGWNKPMFDHFKINTDGASNGYPGPSGAGGIVRDHSGNFISAFSRNLGVTNCLVAELWGIRDGLQMAIDLNLHNKVTLEADSFVAVNLINSPPSCAHITPLLFLIADA
ncbi:reverse transcriptase [Corchorus capsularis]|uniref:Reverse transcriptase n=1 Tax=Corchorus capsularis TaxID=210143 RepID=A0A1R3HSE4_COCAP|nr:reverse transcriptase [Corchorus capsularis]